jgi:AcrR family transcriptional regulator
VPARPAAAPRKSEQTRQRILDAAAKLFRQKGYSEATLERIAAAAGTKAGSLYYHFRSREHLVEQVLAVSMGRTEELVRQHLAALPDGASYRERIAVAVRTHVEHILLFDDYTVAFLKVIDEVPPRIRRRAADNTRAYGRLWSGLIGGAQAAGELRPDLDPSVTRMLLLGGVTWSLEWYKAGKMTPAELAGHVITLFFEGMDRRGSGVSSPRAASGRRRGAGRGAAPGSRTRSRTGS